MEESFLFKNPDFLLKNDGFISNQGASPRHDCSNKFVSVFIKTWMEYLAVVGQQVMRARHFALVGTSRKELMYINRIKTFQDKSLAKMLALFITLGITFGQAGMSLVAGFVFGTRPEDDECVAICSAG